MVRKYRWIRVARIKYPDIDDLPGCLEELTKAGFIHSIDDLVDIDDALELLELAELKCLVKNLKGVYLKQGAAKPLIIKSIKKHISSTKSVTSHFSMKSSASSIGKAVLSQ